MAWLQPWDVICPRCKAKKGRVCRAPYTNKSLRDKAHGDRWNKSFKEAAKPTGASPPPPAGGK